jgi:hypothetical protein
MAARVSFKGEAKMKRPSWKRLKQSSPESGLSSIYKKPVSFWK